MALVGRCCRVCGGAVKFTCSACELVWYCDTAHQRSDWTARHKRECVPAQPPAPVVAPRPPAPPPVGDTVGHRNELREAALALLERGDSVAAMKKAHESLKITETLSRCVPQPGCM